MTTAIPPATTVPEWERRFRAARVGLPDWADDNPGRAVVVATADGVIEVHSWERATGVLTQATSRKEGTSQATLDPAGEWIWWFDDADGDEFGIWRRQPFGSGPSTLAEDAAGLPAAYPTGLALGRDGLALVGRADDDYGTEIHVVTPGVAPRLLYAHAEDAGVAALSEDGRLAAIAHSEHGDSRHPALRVVRVADGESVAELWDGPGLGVDAQGFAPVLGDTRVLVQHERRGFGEVLIWDVADNSEHRLNLSTDSAPVAGAPADGAPVAGAPIDGEISAADWYPDGRAVLIAMDYQARTRLFRVDLADDGVTPTAVTALSDPTTNSATGTVLAATVRPDGDIWTLHSSGAEPAAIRDLAGNVVIAPPGGAAPGSVPVQDVWAQGPGGRVHALLRRPLGPDGEPVARPVPLVVEVHGGPTAHDLDAFRAYAAAWVDHGYAVVQVNYRGSTGYGSAWRDALQTRVGHIELEDVVAVRDHLVAAGIADPDRVVLAGASWGGYLTLLGLGTYPDRWAVGLAGVPVADYVAAYEDEMEGLKAFDRSLFGGSPDQVPDKYRDASPLTYVDAVRAPVLVLAGENDPRCPIRQIENYLTALAERGVPHEIYRYDAGHGSLVNDERVRQMRVELEFAARHLPPG